MGFLDPYERNRSFSLITWMRIGVWTVIGLLAALGWWLFT